MQRGGGAHAFALAAAELAADTRCENVVILDLRGKSPVTEYFVIATGTSPRQMRTVVDEIVDLGKKTGFTAWQQSGYESAKWIVLDCVNVVVHVFDVESRDFYDLELLWGDSPRVDWRKELGLPAEVMMPVDAAREEEGGEEAESGNGDVEEEAEGDVPVETEMADEGAGGVELVEIDPPALRGRKGRDAFPTVVEEDADETEEERAMGPLSAAGAAAASVEEEDEEAMPAKKGKGAAAKKKVLAKKHVVTKRKVVAKKAGKKAVGKKMPARKAAKKSAVKKAAKKGAAKRRRRG